MSFPVHLPAALGSAGTSSQCGPRSAGDMRPLCRSGPRQRISVETIYGHLITIDPGPSCAVATVTSAELPPPTARSPQRHLAITGRSEFELAARSAGLPKLRFGDLKLFEPIAFGRISRYVTVTSAHRAYCGPPGSRFPATPRSCYAPPATTAMRRSCPSGPAVASWRRRPATRAAAVPVSASMSLRSTRGA